ncbi:hypothetical protein HDU67_003467 [Dinochytrium kinnereticum]|nr:hypothetical protein HDU67_003467 [Dinochytrium kinnereticum]
MLRTHMTENGTAVGYVALESLSRVTLACARRCALDDKGDRSATNRQQQQCLFFRPPPTCGMVEISIQRLPEPSPGRKEPTFVRGLGQFSVVGTIRIQSSFPRTLDSVTITLLGQSVVSFNVLTSQYYRRTEHIRQPSVVLSPSNQLNPKAPLIIPFSIEVPAQAFLGALSPQYMALASRPMEEEILTAEGGSVLRFRPSNLVAETWYTMEATVTLVSPIAGFDKYTSPTVRIGEEMSLFEPVVVQALFSPPLITESVNGDGVTITVRVPRVVKNESGFSVALSAAFDAAEGKKKQLEVSGIKIELVQKTTVFVPTLGFPITLPRILPTSSAASFSTTHILRITVTLSEKSLKSLISSSSPAPLVMEVPFTVSPYTKDLATYASSESPWLFLPTEQPDLENESTALPSAVELPPSCWRPGTNVAIDELPVYSAEGMEAQS